MRMTKEIRRGWVRAIMATAVGDERSVCLGIEQQITEMVLGYAERQLPPTVLALWRNQDMKRYVRVDSVYIEGTGQARREFFRVQVPTGGSGIEIPRPLRDRISELLLQLREARMARSEAVRMLERIAAAATTRRHLATWMPRFARFLPPEGSPRVSRVPLPQMPYALDIDDALAAAGIPLEPPPEDPPSPPAEPNPPQVVRQVVDETDEVFAFPA